MSARVVEEPLAVEFAFSRGTRYTLNLHQLPCVTLVRDLAAGLAGLAHPHGNVDARATATQYRSSIGQLCRFLDTAGFCGGAGDLTKARLVEFWLASSPDTERRIRLVLRSLDEHYMGVLRPEVSQYLSGRALRSLTIGQPLPPYSPAEWDRLRRCCEAIIEEAVADQRTAVMAAKTGQDPRIEGSRPVANRLWLLQRHGPMTNTEFAAYLGRPRRSVRSSTSLCEPARRLFPTMPVMLAFRLLLGMTSGIVPDGLEDLGLADIDWAGDKTVLLDYVKGRTRRESLNLPAEAVRVVRRWLEYSALLRLLAPEPVRSSLWLVYRTTGGRASDGPGLRSRDSASVGSRAEASG